MKTKEHNQTSTTNAINNFLSSIYTSLFDLLSSTNHSEDFKHTRTDLITVRLKLMCLLFAISVPISFIFDFFSLGQNLAFEIFPLRLSLSASLMLLFIICHTTLKQRLAYLLLCIAFILPTLFYLAVSFKLDLVNIALPQSLAITPFLIITMLGLFPLTIRLGVILFCCISFSIASFSFLFLHHSIASVLNQLWQLSLFGGVAIWLQLGQLSMLMKLYRESTIDPLTGLINRRVLMRQLDYAFSQRKSNKEPCSLMILDLDKFKRVNDEFGHQVGDKVLKALAIILIRQSNNKAIAARFGGEEFVLFMPSTKIDDAVDRAKEIAESVRNLKIQSDNGQSISVTTSIGISELTHHSTPEQLIKHADELLYKAKLDGRDCIKY